MHHSSFFSKVNLGCCAAVVLAGTVASAADLPFLKARPPIPPPLPVDSWTGFYVGLGGGVSSLNNKLSALPGSDPNSPGISATFDGLGAVGYFASLNAGYDYQVAPAFVVGGFGDYDFQKLKSSVNVDVAAIPLAAHGEISADHQWSVGARFGYLTSPGTLVFLSGGYTQLGLSNLRATASGAFPTMAFVAEVPKISGAFVGAGLETKLTDAISLRTEYRFTSFGSGHVTLPTVDGTTNLNDFVSARIAPTLQVVRATVNYRF
jgi:outer membrane immunogenic protein